jgi:hypothetical protein
MCRCRIHSAIIISGCQRVQGPVGVSVVRVSRSVSQKRSDMLLLLLLRCAVCGGTAHWFANCLHQEETRGVYLSYASP